MVFLIPEKHIVISEHLTKLYFRHVSGHEDSRNFFIIALGFFILFVVTLLVLVLVFMLLYALVLLVFRHIQSPVKPPPPPPPPRGLRRQRY